jgi:hypothetical protein
MILGQCSYNTLYMRTVSYLAHPIPFATHLLVLTVRTYYTSYRRTQKSKKFLQQSRKDTFLTVTAVLITEYTQSGNDYFKSWYIPSWWKNQPSLLRVGGGGRTPTPIHAVYHHVQSYRVYSSCEGRYTPLISNLPLYVLCGADDVVVVRPANILQWKSVSFLHICSCSLGVKLFGPFAVGFMSSSRDLGVKYDCQSPRFLNRKNVSNHLSIHPYMFLPCGTPVIYMFAKVQNLMAEFSACFLFYLLLLCRSGDFVCSIAISPDKNLWKNLLLSFFWSKKTKTFN